METYSEFDSPRIAQNVDADISSDAFRDEGARVLRHDQAPVMGRSRDMYHVLFTLFKGIKIGLCWNVNYN